MKSLCAATRSSTTPRIRVPRAVRVELNRAGNERRAVGGAPPPPRASPSLGTTEAENDEANNNNTRSSDAYYLSALSKARECIFSAPLGQLLGRAGRRCTLEDGERHALRAVASRPPRAAEARLLLAQSLVAQSRGREIEVPRMVVEALSVTETDHLSKETATELVEAAGVAFEKGAGATTGFSSVALFARAVSEAASSSPAASDEVREAVEAAAAAVAARTEVARDRAWREEAVERARGFE